MVGNFACDPTDRSARIRQVSDDAHIDGYRATGRAIARTCGLDGTRQLLPGG
jgi:hypothetical protein